MNKLPSTLCLNVLCVSVLLNATLVTNFQFHILYFTTHFAQLLIKCLVFNLTKDLLVHQYIVCMLQPNIKVMFSDVTLFQNDKPTCSTAQYT